MLNKSLFLTLVVLLLVFGGAVLYTSDSELLSKLNLLEKQPIQETPQNTVSMSKALPSKISTEEMRKLAIGPGQNSPEPVLRKHSENVNAVSVISDILDISSCIPTPNVLNFNPASPITVVNRDAIVRSLAITAKGQTVTFATLNPQSEKIVWLNILTPGIYSYGCEGQGPVGIFLVQ